MAGRGSQPATVSPTLGAEATLQGLFYSCLNFVLLLPLVTLVGSPGFAASHPWLLWISAIVVLLVFPVFWPVSLRALFKCRRVAARIQIPYPTAWDYFFDLREPAFVLIHLRNGGLIGGYMGADSYASSFPYEGDLYLEAAYEVNQKGEFGAPIPDTKGVLLRQDEYSYLELFRVPDV